MFKRKPKKSHKNDEIYIDYSKDVDVKRVEEDEATPEHYKALEVDDEVVVSSIQIKEAVQQKAQEEFIEQRKKEVALEQKNYEEQQTNPITETDLLEPDTPGNPSIKGKLDEEEKIEVDLIRETDLDKESEEHKIEELDEESVDEKLIEHTKLNEDITSHIEKSSQDVRIEHTDDYEETEVEDEDTHDHPIYPSFLHEELSIRRNLDPIKRKSTEEKPLVNDVEVASEELEEDSEEILDKQIEMNDDVQEEDSTQVQLSEEKKQDLHSYFQTDTSVLKKGAKKQRKIEDKDGLEDQRTPLYQYKHHQFYSVQEFMIFLESNYAQLDDIAQGILKDERFFRWIKEESNQFEESIVKMRKFKHKLKQ